MWRVLCGVADEGSRFLCGAEFVRLLALVVGNKEVRCLSKWDPSERWLGVGGSVARGPMSRSADGTGGWNCVLVSGGLLRLFA